MVPFSIEVSHLVVVELGVLTAYVIFGVAGFGTALVASPLLAQFMPVSRIVPLLALLDFAAASTSLVKHGRHADKAELRRLVPLMLVGSGIGASVLLFVRPDVLILLLGIFVTAYSAYALSGYVPRFRFGAAFAIPFGLVGGVFSALFGSGGFIYSIYLQNRLTGKEAIRVTQIALIGMSTLTRFVIFLVAGVYAELQLLLLAALLAPAMIVGTWIGRRITLNLSRKQFIRVVSGVVLVSGAFLIVRYFS